MNFKVVRNAAGELICYGPNDNNYGPGIPAGCTLFIEANIPADSESQLRIKQAAKIKDSAESALKAISAPYPPSEIDTWHVQYAEALAYKAAATAPVPILTAIATAAGITVAALATAVIDKATAFNTLAGGVVGKRKKLIDQLNALPAGSTKAQIEAVAW